MNLYIRSALWSLAFAGVALTSAPQRAPGKSPTQFAA